MLRRPLGVGGILSAIEILGWGLSGSHVDRSILMSRTRRSFLRLGLALALLTSLLGCGWLPFRVEGERPLMGERGPQRKTVTAKEAPDRLIAVDGTLCIVSASKFESVEVNDKVWCAGRPRGE